ncbi:MAG: hypothetical protein PHY43_04885 [Verrucomicrobiales bacterium]|nr:hypothetical protein [Verrucomicrobiales bacterium]
MSNSQVKGTPNHRPIGSDGTFVRKCECELFAVAVFISDYNSPFGMALLVDEPMELGPVIARRQTFERLVKERGLSQCPVWDCETKIGEDPFETAKGVCQEPWHT